MCHVKSSVPYEVILQELSAPGGIFSGGVESSISGMRWFKLIQQNFSSRMMPLRLLSMGAGLAGLHRFSAGQVQSLMAVAPVEVLVAA